MKKYFSILFALCFPYLSQAPLLHMIYVDGGKLKENVFRTRLIF